MSTMQKSTLPKIVPEKVSLARALIVAVVQSVLNALEVIACGHWLGTGLGVSLTEKSTHVTLPLLVWVDDFLSVRKDTREITVVNAKRATRKTPMVPAIAVLAMSLPVRC